MKIYLVSMTEPVGYDMYDSAVVIAKDEDEARYIHPSGDEYWDSVQNKWFYIAYDGSKVYTRGWTNYPETLKVTYIGEAPEDAVKSVVLSSFIAG